MFVQWSAEKSSLFMADQATKWRRSSGSPIPIFYGQRQLIEFCARLSRSLHDAVFDAAVAEPAFGSVIAGDRVGASIALGDEHVRIGALFDQCLANCFSPPLRQRDILLCVASVVGVASDLEHVPL